MATVKELEKDNESVLRRFERNEKSGETNGMYTARYDYEENIKKQKQELANKINSLSSEEKKQQSYKQDLDYLVSTVNSKIDTANALIAEHEEKVKETDNENVKENQKTSTMSEIAAKVKAIIVDKLSVDEAEVKNEASFANDLGADSLDTVELIMEFEKEFGISIPDDQAEKISTVGDAIAYIEANA